MGKPLLPTENDILFAYKALSIAPGLSNSARQVAGALIDHFNRKSGRCDPSAQRLADLLGMHRITVLKATRELTKQGDGLFEKASHGGRHCTASYQPKWHRFCEIVSEWKGKMQGIIPDDNVAERLCSTEPNGYVGDSQTATQTNLNNQSNNQSKGIPEEIPEKAIGESFNVQPQPSEQTDSSTKGLLKKKRKRQTQIPMLLPFNGGRSPSHAKAASLAASKRIDCAMMKLDPKRYVALMEAVSPDCYEQAAIAECKRHGAGMAHILAEVGRCAHG